MNFRYFQAPYSEMYSLSKETQACDLCGREELCFDLTRALTPERLAPAQRGCLRCLNDRRFGFFHVTAAGYLDETGLTWYGDPPITPPRPAPPGEDAVAELRSTPTFSTWNDVSWPVHCRDFMSFLGSWQPRDVSRVAASRGVSARELFESMVKPIDRTVWDGADEWGLHFMVFICCKCEQFHGVIDLD